jgi:hypothetical protein
MEAFYVTLAIGSTVMMSMFAAVYSQKIEADRAAGLAPHRIGEIDF